MRASIWFVSGAFMFGCGGSAAGLVSVSPATSECATGGVVISTGADDNGNGVLDSGEVDSTQAVCNGEQGKAGANGTNGANGANGAAGATGANGADNHITQSILCQGAVSTTGWSAKYQAVTMSYGDRMAWASIAGVAFQVTGVSFLSKNANAIATAPVIIASDASGTNNNGWWQISYNTANDVSIVEYHDTDLGGTGVQSWTMPGTFCQKVAY